ncbi:hypothetical protein HAX54_020334, partial [Datura stramonium]|nr:hypothetical protein [Datura stramonium]
ASVPRRALSQEGRPAPHAWNCAGQGPRRASSSAARPVPRASGRAAVAGDRRLAHGIILDKGRFAHLVAQQGQRRASGRTVVA